MLFNLIFTSLPVAVLGIVSPSPMFLVARADGCPHSSTRTSAQPPRKPFLSSTVAGSRASSTPVPNSSPSWETDSTNPPSHSLFPTSSTPTRPRTRSTDTTLASGSLEPPSPFAPSPPPISSSASTFVIGPGWFSSSLSLRRWRSTSGSPSTRSSLSLLSRMSSSVSLLALFVPETPR